MGRLKNLLSAGQAGPVPGAKVSREDLPSAPILKAWPGRGTYRAHPMLAGAAALTPGPP